MKTNTGDRILAKSTLLLLAFAPPFISELHGASTILASGVWNGNGHTYYLVQFDSNTDHLWDSARAEVTTMFGQGFSLATITSADEDAFIRGLVGGRGPEWWLGGVQDPITETDAAAGWTWVTGEPFTYSNWGYGEPNDAGTPGFEQHLALDFGGLFWNDEGSALSIVAGYVVETQPIPEPGIPVLFAVGSLAFALCRRANTKRSTG